ncbi:hypothetical protein CEUSTIGMA_g8275.t1 [Chlamydomonas eustigma]|uniref:Major facilitator superfamily (MFS) profile domain-containing protein n=1 Tax=Chlamydomonas eustigma TaxID=1157962 RepID=A0A250XDL0_9CHLO|nr:hypothetical protein CEUSTIGMA_g8275.t1 [Chlamydomonas eustigma]|eukprot:GAX80840.1 hypothetical protein CEUSTIGMA_g8275.t1 [Chlamydomonas eustigma]
MKLTAVKTQLSNQIARQTICNVAERNHASAKAFTFKSSRRLLDNPTLEDGNYSANYTDDSSPLSASFSSAWDKIPARNKLVAACCSAFVLSNMDKVNMTVAVIPIAHELGWSSTVTGLVQSSFFWGFLLAQIPGGYLSSSLGGRTTLPPAVALWSTTTALLPLTAGSLPALCLLRSVMGSGEAIAPSAVVDMLARTIPKESRAGAVSTAFSGLHIGTILGLIASPAIISVYGWRTLFLAFGAVGIAWYFGFQALMDDIKRQEPELLDLLEAPKTSSTPSAVSSNQPLVSLQGSPHKTGKGMSVTKVKSGLGSLHVPYRAMLRSQPVRVLMFTHFAHNWLNYTMLAWLPTYFTDTLSVDLLHASQTALLPPLASIVTATLAGRTADYLISSAGVPVSVVRKAAQSTAFLVPAALLTFLCLHGEAEDTPLVDTLTDVTSSLSTVVTASAGNTLNSLPSLDITGLMSDEATLTVTCVTLALGVSSFSLAGLYCTHQDLSPKYASAMLGVTNTAASLPGAFGVAMVGFLLDHTDRCWEVSLLAPAAVVLSVSALVYAAFGSNDAVDYDTQDDSPFPWEKKLLQIKDAVGNVAGSFANFRKD